MESRTGRESADADGRDSGDRPRRRDRTRQESRAWSHPVPCPPVRSTVLLSWITFWDDVRARLYLCQLLLEALHFLLQLLHLISQRDEER